MRIAVCVYGDVVSLNRWWPESADVFVHTWDRTAEPTPRRTKKPNNVKGYSRTKRPSYDLDAQASLLTAFGHLPKPGLPTDQPDTFDSIRRSLMIRREYELENDITYDVVILTRSDLKTDGQLIFPTGDELRGEIHGLVTLPRSHFGRRVIAGKPRRIDLLAYMWNALPRLRSGMMDMRTRADPDQTIHFYLASLGVEMRDSGMTTEILRSAQYGALACETYGGMRHYETI